MPSAAPAATRGCRRRHPGPGAAARRHRQGRHRQDHRRRRAGPRPGRAPAARCCSSRSRPARRSPSCSTSRRCPTRRTASPASPTAVELYGLAIDAEQAMIEYLDMFYGLKRSARGLKKMGAVDFVTTLAPGLRDVLLTGKVKESVVRKVGRQAGLRRRRARRPAHRPHQPLPRRHAGGREADEVRPDQQAERGRHQAAARPADRRAHRDAARGDAGPGDDRRRRTSCAASASTSAR